MTDFIEVYDHWMDAALCRSIIEKFEAGPQVRGRTGQGVDLQKKDSYDLTITNLPAWRPLVEDISEVAFRGVLAYLRKYPFLLVGALSPSVMSGITGQPEPLSHEDISSLADPQLADLAVKMYRLGSINVQKYSPDRGGYHHWHSEIYPRDETCETLHRVLFIMFYLNSVSAGGETTFFYQSRSVKPHQGRMMIAPAGFTHTHKGNVARSADKYVLTSWIMFRRAEVLFAC